MEWPTQVPQGKRQMEKALLANPPNLSLTPHQVNQGNICFYYLNKVTSLC